MSRFLTLARLHVGSAAIAIIPMVIPVIAMLRGLAVHTVQGYFKDAIRSES